MDIHESNYNMDADVSIRATFEGLSQYGEITMRVMMSSSSRVSW